MLVVLCVHGLITDKCLAGGFKRKWGSSHLVDFRQVRVSD